MIISYDDQEELYINTERQPPDCAKKHTQNVYDTYHYIIEKRKPISIYESNKFELYLRKCVCFFFGILQAFR